MKTIERIQIEKSKQSIENRLSAPAELCRPDPVIESGNIHYEVSEKTKAISYGGIGLILQLADRIGLAEKIDERLKLLKFHMPYHESDHVINIAINGLCNGRTLGDIELRRCDEAFLNAIGADRIPDPTTAGDFCRRFVDDDQILTLMDAINEARLEVWKEQPKEFFEQAILDVDGTLSTTTGCCKEGMEYSYKKVWGYHPLLVTLANTSEVVSIYNRPGNRPSHEGAWIFLDDAVDLVRRAGFRKVLLRGDTDFSQCHKLDDWDARDVHFVFGFDANPKLCALADNLAESRWTRLQRRDKHPPKGERRSRPENVKDRIVFEREFEKITTVSEEIAEFWYQPGLCKQKYRIVVIRKNLTAEKGENHFWDDVKYFFYITNLADATAEQVVWEANDRCNQENLIEQLKNGIPALHAPVNTLLANWAYMVMMALGWNLKAWLALSLPAGRGKQHQQDRHDKRMLLTMEFRRFVQMIMQVPCQIVRTGRKIVYRILAWNPLQPIFLRLAEVLRE